MMHSIIQFVGAIIVTLAIFALGIAVFVAFTTDGGMIGSLPVLAAAVGTIISGAILYCFGAIVEHLIAIRRNTEAQLQIFQERLGSQ